MNKTSACVTQVIFCSYSVQMPSQDKVIVLKRSQLKADSVIVIVPITNLAGQNIGFSFLI